MPKFGMSQLAPTLEWPKYFYQGFNRQYFRKVLSYRPIAFWPLWEASGSVAYDISKNGNHGAYVTATLAQAGLGHGRSCAYFDGANDYMDAYSTGLRDAFNGAAGTISIWLRCFDATPWEDSGIHTPIRFVATSDNDVQIRIQTANTMRFRYFADGVAETIDVAGLSTLDWFHAAITWDKAANAFKAFLDGAQVGATQTIANTWDGTLAINNCTIGAYSEVPNNLWYGWIADPAIFDYALAPTRIADLALV